MSDKVEKEFVNGYMLAKTEVNSFRNVVNILAEKTNEHALVIFALCKRLGVTPQQLIESLEPGDFVNPEDNPEQTNATLLVS